MRTTQRSSRTRHHLARQSRLRAFRRRARWWKSLRSRSPRNSGKPSTSIPHPEVQAPDGLRGWLKPACQSRHAGVKLNGSQWVSPPEHWSGNTRTENQLPSSTGPGASFHLCLEPGNRDAGGVVRNRRGGDDRNDLERMIFAETRRDESIDILIVETSALFDHRFCDGRERGKFGVFR